MKITLDVGDREKYRIEYDRNWFTGKERLSAHGQHIASRSMSSSNYVSVLLARRYEFYEFTVGAPEPKAIIFEKERPLRMVDFRPLTYRVFVDGKLIFQRRGY